MQTRGSTTKSPIKLSAAENKLTRWFVYEWGKTKQQKPYQVIFRSPLPKLYYYHNKRLQVKEFQVPYQPTVEPLPQYPIGLVL